MRFEHVRTAPGGSTRNRLINIRVRELNTPNLFKQSISEPLADLRLVERLSTRSPQYVIDLNVMFDVVRKRVNAEDAGKIMSAGFNNLIRLAVTGEFIEELKRNSQPPDPVLEFAMRLPILPQPVQREISNMLNALAVKIFPQRAHENLLKTQDRSDLIHLATAIHHQAAGFVTSEKAILNARDFLQESYGLDVVGVAEMAALADVSVYEDSARISMATDGIELHARPVELGDLNQISELLMRLGVASQLVNEISRSIMSDGAEQALIFAGDQPIAFANWTNETQSFVQAFICADEDNSAIETALDHMLDNLSRTACGTSPAFIRLRLVAGHTRTRSVAISHGYRPSAGQPDNAPVLQKICAGRCIKPEDWDMMRNSLKRAAGLVLPDRMPHFRVYGEFIQISTPAGTDVQVSLQDLETLLSPVLLVLPGRGGAIVPIRARFAAHLFGKSPQLELLGSPEARFLRERVYFSDPRTRPLLGKGQPIIFYESGKDNGRSSVVAVARVLRTDFISKESVVSDLLRRGVLNGKALQRMGRSPFLAATMFDNLMHFRKPIPFDHLRRLGFHDPTNLVTTRPISDDVLRSIIREGDPVA